MRSRRRSAVVSPYSNARGVPRYLLGQAVADIVQIFRLKKVGRGPLLNPVLVVRMVVQGEDRLDALPLTLLGRDASTALVGRVCDQLVYDAESFSFVEGFCFESFTCLSRGCRCAHTVDPVVHPTHR
jgi:hypothetical protein